MEAAPYLFEMTAARSDKPTKGFCLLPKRAVSVMTCEVDRVFKVQENAVVPISYIVPRKVSIDEDNYCVERKKRLFLCVFM